MGKFFVFVAVKKKKLCKEKIFIKRKYPHTLK